MLLIGLTGPSGAGKSTVANVFRRYGLPVLDADEIYHDLLLPPSACLSELVLQFGSEILNPDGTLNRPRLAALALPYPDRLRALNEIAHRHVMADIRRRVRQLQAEGIPAAVLDAPQLFESGADRDCSVIVSVLCDREVRLQRILARDHLTVEEAERRFNAQHDDKFFRLRSDYIIENDRSAEHLEERVLSILRETGAYRP